MSDTTMAVDRCPLCGGPNACGIAAGQSTCWCFVTRIPAAVLERIPAEARNRSCICQICATLAVTSAAERGGAEDR